MGSNDKIKNSSQKVSNTIKVNLGCGTDIKPGFVNIDVMDLEGVDIQLDLEKDTLPFNDNEVSLIFASHVLEHIKNIHHLFYEIYRVLEVGGKFIFVVPAWSSSGAFQDPTHVRFFHPITIRYFVNDTKDNYFPDIHFEIAKFARKRSDYYRRLRKMIGWLIGYERFDRWVDAVLLNMDREYWVSLRKTK